MRQNSKVSSALTAEAARWCDASISARMSPRRLSNSITQQHFIINFCWQKIHYQAIVV